MVFTFCISIYWICFLDLMQWFLKSLCCYGFEFVHSWRKGSLFNTVCVGNDHIFLRKVYESKTIYTSMGVCVCVYICVVVVLKKKNYICEAIYLLVVKWLHFLLLFLDLKIWRNQTILEGNCSLPLSLSCVCVAMEYIHFCRYLFYL